MKHEPPAAPFRLLVGAGPGGVGPVGDPAPSGDPVPAPDPAPVPDPPADPAPAPAPSGDPAPPAPTVDPDELQALRDQLAQEQVKAGDRAKDAAKKATDDLTRKLGLALGLVEDEGAKAPDPVKLAEQAAAHAKEAKATRIENAVIREAPKNGGDVDALLDSTAFTRELGKLDPSAEGFRDAVADLIKSTVAANPKYAAAPLVPQRSGGDSNVGDNEGTGQITREQLSRMSPKDVLAAHKAGRLKSVTG